MLGRFFKNLFILTLSLHIIYFLIVGGFSLYLKFENPSTTSLMLYRSHFDVDEMKKPKFIPLSYLPQDLIESIINLEDPNFWKHSGYDMGAMIKAYKINQEKGYYAYGGSTISQQLARSLFLFPHKNYMRKYLELIAAVEMEMVLDKERILELYFNYTEWGRNVYGIRDAANFYYKKDVRRLSRTQKIKLATILAMPLQYDPTNYKKEKTLEARYELLDKYILE